MPLLCSAQYLSRSGFLYSLPVGRRGMRSMKSTLRGHFMCARCVRQYSISSASSAAPALTIRRFATRCAGDLQLGWRQCVLHARDNRLRRGQKFRCAEFQQR